MPQVTPLGFGVDEDRLCFNIKHTSKKARNLKLNPKVSFVADYFPPWDGIAKDISGELLWCKAELVSEGEFHEKGKERIEEKFPGYEANWGVMEDWWSKYILVVTPTKVQSWRL